MKINKFKKVLIFFLTICFIIILHNVSEAASMGMSINKSSAYVGDTFSITISGINGKVKVSGNSNVSLNKTGNQWVDGSLTITGTAKSVGTGTVTVTPIDATTTAAEPEEVTASASRSITIKQKETPTTPTPTPDPKPDTKPATKPSTPTKTETKTETKKDTETKENKEDNFYILNVTLKGIKENDEKIDISLSPEFNKNIYEYTCNISSDVKYIELQKDAGEYTNSIIVTGLEELKDGENIVKLKLSAEDHEAKTYTIKIIKEASEVVETIAEVGEDNNEQVKEERKPIMVSMPLWVFIVMQVGIIVIEVLIINFVPWRKIFKRRKIDIDIEE